ncbi:MAG: YiiX/YebB-like N1pC/P60 family cysteine hydrolase [Flavobacteriaceae bacterium]
MNKFHVFFLLFSFYFNLNAQSTQELSHALEKQTIRLQAQRAYFNKIGNPDYVLTGEDLLYLAEYSSELDRIEQQAFLKVKSLNDSHNPPLVQELIIRNALFELILWEQSIIGKHSRIYIIMHQNNSNSRIANHVVSSKYRKESLRLYKQIEKNGDSTKNWQQLTNQAYYKKFLIDKAHQREAEYFFETYQYRLKVLNEELYKKIFLDESLNAVSRRFSNYVGGFAYRKGKLYKQVDFIEKQEQELQILDVVLEKTPFRMTDKLIPGFWGHAGIYVGNEAQLKDLGIWDDPKVIPYHKVIRSGASIVEALRTEVEVNSVEHFSNIDDYAHLRLQNPPSKLKQQQMVLRAFEQIGKSYDFGFDVESSERIVCSELLYVVYDQVKFNTSQILGRATISVDQVAEKAGPQGDFKLENLYLNGKQVPKDQQNTYFEKLPNLSDFQLNKLKKAQE